MKMLNPMVGAVSKKIGCLSQAVLPSFALLALLSANCLAAGEQNPLSTRPELGRTLPVAAAKRVSDTTPIKPIHRGTKASDGKVWNQPIPAIHAASGQSLKHKSYPSH